MTSLLEYKYYKGGSHIAEFNTKDTFFILKGEVFAIEARSERNIMQDHYWQKKLKSKKLELDNVHDE